MWTVWGDSYSTAEGTDLTKFQPVVFNQNVIITAIKARFIVFNDPNFTAISCKIYSNQADAPAKLLYTSTNSVTKDELITLDNGIKECAFLFNSPTFIGTETYHLVFNLTGYTGSSTSHVALAKYYPDYGYKTNIDTGYNSLLSGPYHVYFIGSAL